MATKKKGGVKPSKKKEAITMRTVKAPEASTTSLKSRIVTRLSGLKKGEALEIGGVPRSRQAYIRTQVSMFNKKSNTKFAVSLNGDKMIVCPK